jgi:hypothetical protein
VKVHGSVFSTCERVSPPGGFCREGGNVFGWEENIEFCSLKKKYKLIEKR